MKMKKLLNVCDGALALMCAGVALSRAYSLNYNEAVLWLVAAGIFQLLIEVRNK